jgi:hypothetical protein
MAAPLINPLVKSPINALSSDHFTSIFAFLNVKELLKCRRLSRYISDQTWKTSSWIGKYINVMPPEYKLKYAENNMSLFKNGQKIISEFFEIKDLASIKLCQNIYIITLADLQISAISSQWINCLAGMLCGGFNNLLTLTLANIELTVQLCEAIKVHPRLKNIVLGDVFTYPDGNSSLPEVQDILENPLLNAFAEIFKTNMTLTSLSISIVDWKSVASLSMALSSAINLKTLSIRNKIIPLSKALQDSFAMMVLANKTVTNFTHNGMYGLTSRNKLMPKFILSSSLESLSCHRLTEYINMLHASNDTLKSLEFTGSDDPAIQNTGDCSDDFIAWLTANRSLETLIMPRMGAAEPKYHMHPERWNDEDQHNMYHDDQNAPLPHSIENEEFVKYARLKSRESTVLVTEITSHPYTLFTKVICNHSTLQHLTLTFSRRDLMILPYISLLKHFHGCKLQSLTLTQRACDTPDVYRKHANKQEQDKTQNLALSYLIDELYSASLNLLNSSPQLHLDLTLFIKSSFAYVLNEAPKEIQSRVKLTILNKFPQ